MSSLSQTELYRQWSSSSSSSSTSVVTNANYFENFQNPKYFFVADCGFALLKTIGRREKILQ